MDQATYNAGYLASLPPVISSLMKLVIDYNIPILSGRTVGFIALKQQGYIIDAQIMVYGQDPFDTMYERNVAGFKSVPAFLQDWPTNPPIPPGLTYAGITGSQTQGDVVVYWPNPPAPLNPAPPVLPTPTLTLSIQIEGFPGYFEMSGDSPSIPISYKEVIDGIAYTKTIISQSPFAPNGVVTGWLKSTS